jgi:hypothetical protein
MVLGFNRFFSSRTAEDLVIIEEKTYKDVATNTEETSNYQDKINTDNSTFDWQEQIKNNYTLIFDDISSWYTNEQNNYGTILRRSIALDLLFLSVVCVLIYSK